MAPAVALLMLLGVPPSPAQKSEKETIGYRDRDAVKGAVGGARKLDLKDQATILRHKDKPKIKFDPLLSIVPVMPLPEGSEPAGTGYRLALRSVPVRTAEVRFTWRGSFPEAMPVDFVIYCPEPPTLPGQTVHGFRMDPEARAISELSDAAQPMLYARVRRVRGKYQDRLEVNAGGEVTLEDVRLVRTPKAKGGDPTPPKLSDEERTRYLARTDLFDFDHEAVGRFVEELNLARQPGEQDADYAYRVFQIIRYRLSFRNDPPALPNVSSVLTSGRMRHDSLGLCVTYGALLRRGGVPARVRVGRWLADSAADNAIRGGTGRSPHARVEFFADGVGWVPVDFAMALRDDPSPAGLMWFGHDDGGMLTLHLDGPVRVDSLHDGKHDVVAMTGVRVWYKGIGLPRGVVTGEHFQVRQLPTRTSSTAVARSSDGPAPR
jgi:transglutaminase-like putative cysteine protease